MVQRNRQLSGPVYGGVIDSDSDDTSQNSAPQIDVGTFESSRSHALPLRREPVVVMQPTKESSPVIDIVSKNFVQQINRPPQPIHRAGSVGVVRINDKIIVRQELEISGFKYFICKTSNTFFESQLGPLFYLKW